MALKFRHLSVPQAKQALRHRGVNSTDLTSSQSSHERRDAVGQCGHDTRHRHPTGLYSSMLLPPQEGILFDKPHLRDELRHRLLSCVFYGNMNSLKINKKHFETNKSLSSRSHLRPSSANPRAQFRNFANVAKTRNPDARQAT